MLNMDTSIEQMLSFRHLQVIKSWTKPDIQLLFFPNYNQSNYVRVFYQGTKLIWFKLGLGMT